MRALAPAESKPRRDMAALLYDGKYSLRRWAKVTVDVKGAPERVTKCSVNAQRKHFRIIVDHTRTEV